jgi:hypothetical protein
LPSQALPDVRIARMLTPQAFACRHLNLFFRIDWFFLQAFTVLIRALPR